MAIQASRIVRAVVAAQRMWVACNMTGDPFKAWATEDMALVREEVMAAYIGGFNPDTLRAELEALAMNGPDGTRFALPAYSEGTIVPFAVPEFGVQFWPLNSEASSTSRITISIAWQSLDGSVAAVPKYLTQEQAQDPSYQLLTYPGLYNTAIHRTDDGITYLLVGHETIQG